MLLSKYFDILDENRTAKYLQCKHIPVSFKITDSTDNLWKIHNSITKNIKLVDIEPKQSLLDLKIELSSRIFKNCCFCERRCRVDRTKKPGNCGIKQPHVASEFLHLGEERVLVPSHTIFFSGCTFNCIFCQNWDISQVDSGLYIKPNRMVEIIQKRKIKGARNVNWVGGDPTPNLPYILKVLKLCNENIPQVWNSNMYCSNETMSLLSNVIDLYLTDFKYGNNKCAKRLSNVNSYLEIVKRNHKIAHENGEMIMRHLVMPNHVNCCSKPIMDWIADNLSNAVVNIMSQYRPEYKAYEYQDIQRSVSIDEFLEVKDYADELKIHLV
ncbi:radical SAM protein [Thermoplasmatales archaeon SG8-52-4]|nr:MAG: radical SAM protein [Thermoplasmatales archaeon SG8-52-4]